MESFELNTLSASSARNPASYNPSTAQPEKKPPAKKPALQIADGWMLRSEVDIFFQGTTADTFAVDPAASVGLGGGPQFMHPFGRRLGFSEFRIGPYFSYQSQEVSAAYHAANQEDLPDKSDAVVGQAYHQLDNVMTYTQFSPISLGVRANIDCYLISDPKVGRVYLGPSLAIMGHAMRQSNHTTHVYQTLASDSTYEPIETDGGRTTESALGLTAKAALNLRIGHGFGSIGGGVLVNPFIEPMNDSPADATGFIEAGIGMVF